MKSPALHRTPSMTIESHASKAAAFLALQSFAKHSGSLTIQMKMNSFTEVIYIKKLGGTHKTHGSESRG